VKPIWMRVGIDMITTSAGSMDSINTRYNYLMGMR